MRNVKQVLLGTGKISEQEINNVLSEYGPSNTEGVWRSFVTRGVVSEIEVFQSLAKMLNFRFINAQKMDIAADVLTKIPAQVSREQRILPMGLKNKTLYILTDEPENFEAIDSLSASTPYAISTMVTTTTAMNELMVRYLRQDDEMNQLSEELLSDNEDDTEDDLDVGEDLSTVVRLVNIVINQAIQDRASDVHIEPQEDSVVIRYRIDGVLKVVQRAPKKIQKEVISRLKVMSDIDVAVKAVPQDGRMSVKHNGRTIDIRVATNPVVWGEKVVLRILDSSTEKRSIKSISMTSRNEEIFKRAIEKPNGMILVTGPTGSGKSTTLYVALDEVARPEVNVITVEDPVEKKIKGINQMQINNKAGMTFSSALRSILRSDPDVILLGEIRDEETAKIAIDASMTGHLVLSTLHTNGAPEAAARLTEMGVEPFLVSGSLTCAMAQRLARRLCDDCKEEASVDAELAERVGFPDPEFVGYGPVGCVNCADTGYKGRIALTEVLEVTDDIAVMIAHGETANSIRTTAEKNGMRSLMQDGWEKVLMGVTTIDEVLRVASK